MNIEDYNYELDESFIAQSPLKNRSDSKLLVLNRKTGCFSHDNFYNIVNYLNSGDVLVLNDTKVIPARLIGEKKDTKAIIEVLLLKDLGANIWECLVKHQKRVKVGTVVNFSDKLSMECVSIFSDGITHFKLNYNGILMNILDELGTMPLPPYIHEKLSEQNRYQTVYASNIGSAAAPTAGLHFTKELLDEAKTKGVEVVYITLHVGLGTFRPIKEDNVLDHKMHSEYYEMTKESASSLNKAKKESRRIICVGTTSMRTLESIYSKYNTFKEVKENTDIFIYPGYEFKAASALITNFHLPKSSLLLLVSAFSSKELIFKAYEEAKEKNYRFFSFGDAMFIE